MKYSAPKKCGCEARHCDSSAASEDLASQCIALGKAMYKQADRFLSAYRLTPPQYEILTVLSHEGTVPLNRVSEYLCCACSNVTGIVDRLERDGLVRRERSPDDRRVVLLGLTDEGRELWESVPRDGCCETWFDTILNDEEKSELHRILTKLISAMA